MIANVFAPDVPPPGVGLVTVICAVPFEAKLAAGMEARMMPLVTYCTTNAVPFHCTVEAGTNPAPETVTVAPGVPITAALGERPTIDGEA